MNTEGAAFRRLLGAELWYYRSDAEKRWLTGGKRNVRVKEALVEAGLIKRVAGILDLVKTPWGEWCSAAGTDEVARMAHDVLGGQGVQHMLGLAGYGTAGTISGSTRNALKRRGLLLADELTALGRDVAMLLWRAYGEGYRPGMTHGQANVVPAEVAQADVVAAEVAQADVIATESGAGRRGGAGRALTYEEGKLLERVAIASVQSPRTGLLVARSDTLKGENLVKLQYARSSDRRGGGLTITAAGVLALAGLPYATRGIVERAASTVGVQIEKASTGVTAPMLAGKAIANAADAVTDNSVAETAQSAQATFVAVTVPPVLTRRCEICGKQLAGRRDAKTCSTNCRQAKARLRSQVERDGQKALTLVSALAREAQGQHADMARKQLWAIAEAARKAGGFR